VTRNKFHIELQIFSTTVQNLVARETWCPGLVHLWYGAHYDEFKGVTSFPYVHVVASKEEMYFVSWPETYCQHDFSKTTFITL